MAAQTDTELLAATRAAIDALTTGKVKSYTIGDRTVTYHDLSELWTQVSRLESRIARTATGARAAVVRFGNPS